MFPSIVDVAGLNRISRVLLTRAAGAICGMVEVSSRRRAPTTSRSSSPAMFGNTTACVQHARKILGGGGYEVLVFHADRRRRADDGIAHRIGMVAGVLDMTTTEWADELVGGVLTAGPHAP